MDGFAFYKPSQRYSCLAAGGWSSRSSSSLVTLPELLDPSAVVTVPTCRPANGAPSRRGSRYALASLPLSFHTSSSPPFAPREVGSKPRRPLALPRTRRSCHVPFIFNAEQWGPGSRLFLALVCTPLSRWPGSGKRFGRHIVDYEGGKPGQGGICHWFASRPV